MTAAPHTKPVVHCLLLLVTFSFANPAQGGEPPAGASATCDTPLTPSSLLARGPECDGQHVVVRGFLRDGFEMHGLWDSEADIERSNYLHACITVFNPQRLSVSGPVRLVQISGVFRARRPARLVILGSCTDAVLEIERVTNLREVPSAT